ncbi:helix-turn-helix domain-containing protein [Paenibacillus sepulcri]|uniref:Response regulator n=1 Tax=Paenibacillus sepulcri TaxID=359917 RepID=A0ABS7C2F0_9BACL|nr:response regulator [Paenibacillus sepulcri]
MLKVLIVDDENWVVESLKDMVDWQSHGFEVVGQAYNGVDALEAMNRLKPDVVFTDIRMPEMNGLELIQRARSLAFPIHFVVVSGYAEFAYAQKALTHGALAYCLKPFDEIEINGVLAKISRMHAVASPARDSSLIHLLEDPNAGNQLKLQEELEKEGFSDWSSAGIAAVVSVGSSELESIQGPVIKLKIGTAKTAFLLQERQAAALRDKWRTGVPQGIRGIGFSGKITDLGEIREAISGADMLAHQFFVTGKPAVYDQQPFRDQELNRYMVDMSTAVRDKDNPAIHLVFERIGELFRAQALSIRHAFQVYNMTVSFLFKLGQTESILYSYEQLVQSYEHVFAMLDELESLATGYSGTADPLSVETKNRTFNAILRFVTDHFTQELSLQSLADQFFMNPSYISQLFKKEVGETFTAYISRLRIAYARELLDHEQYSIQEIAEKIGYQDYFYFARIFKKMTGTTPSQYRNDRE